jgi:hypothetical protein
VFDQVGGIGPPRLNWLPEAYRRDEEQHRGLIKNAPLDHGQPIQCVPFADVSVAARPQRQIPTWSRLQLSESFEIEGQDMFSHACKLGLEGRGLL